MTKRLQTPEEVEKYFPGFLSFIDCTAKQQIPRPKDKDRRKMYYSGKKKRHTIKNQFMMVNNSGYILHKANNHKKGHRHDYIFKNIRITILSPLNKLWLMCLTLDILVGVEKDFPEQLSALPCKKKRNQKDLSQEEKEYNKIHSKKKRIVIEHTICRQKIYRILADVFRNKLRKYDKVSDIVGGPVNY